MKTDEWLAIEADPHYRDAPPEKQAAMAAIYKHVRAKKPLVLASAADKPKPKPRVEMNPAPATLKDEVTALLPEFPGEDPVLLAARENRLRNPPAPGIANRFVRSFREALPAAAESGVSSSLVAGANRNALMQAAPATRKPIHQPPLVLESARNPEPEPGVLNALVEVARDPSRLKPGSPGFVEGVGAAAPHMLAATVDPAGAAVGALAFKAAAPVVKGAGRAAGAMAKKVADVPIPPKALEIARRIIEDEEGIYVPGGVQRGLDQADNAFEAAGQATMRGAETVGTVGKAILDSAASRVADDAQRLGDVLHIPKVKAEEAANAVAQRIDLKGRTGKTADEWYQTLKNEPATTSSPVVNSLLDTRRYFVSDFGMTPEMKAIREAGRVYGNNAARPLEELGVRLNKERTGEEQFNIHWQATEGTPPPGPMNPQTILDAIEVKKASRQADQALVDKGALTPEVAAQYDGTHLPRAYAKWWRAEGNLGQALRHPINTISENKIGGWYQRGLKETVSENEFLARQASAAQTGENWREVARHGDGTVTIHRDWTIPERQAWGEIRNASSALQRKAHKTRRDASSAYILDAYAQPGAGDAKGAFAIPAQPGSVPPPGYQLLDSATAKESGIPKYGRLANHFVRDDVAFYLRTENELKPIINKINKYTMNNLWKKMVTIGNFPGYFVNNYFQNPLILERTGGSMADMPAAWAKLASNDIDIQRLEDLSVIRNGVLARELGSQLQHFNATLSSPHMHDGFSIPKQIFRAMNALKAYEQNGYKLAGASDDLYRVALVEGLMRRGDGVRSTIPFEEAAEIAKKAFYDSDAVTAPAAQIATTFSPFAKVLWWAANNEAEAWTKNPGKAAYINTLVAALPVAMSFAMGKGLAQQDAEQLALPSHMQGHGNSFPIPYKDEEGRNYHVDASSWNHYNQFKPIDNTAASVKLPFSIPVIGDMVGYPKGLAPGGPASTLAQYLWNYDAFTGKELVNRDADKDVISDDSTDFLIRNLAPGVVRNGSALYGTMTGDTGATEKRNNLTQNIRTVTGIKTRPADIPKAIVINNIKRDEDVRDISLKMRREEKMENVAVEEGNPRAASRHRAKRNELKAQRDKVIAAAQDRHRRLTRDN